MEDKSSYTSNNINIENIINIEKQDEKIDKEKEQKNKCDKEIEEIKNQYINDRAIIKASRQKMDEHKEKNIKIYDENIEKFTNHIQVLKNAINKIDTIESRNQEKGIVTEDSLIEKRQQYKSDITNYEIKIQVEEGKKIKLANEMIEEKKRRLISDVLMKRNEEIKIGNAKRKYRNEIKLELHEQVKNIKQQEKDQKIKNRDERKKIREKEIAQRQMYENKRKIKDNSVVFFEKDYINREYPVDYNSEKFDFGNSEKLFDDKTKQKMKSIIIKKSIEIIQQLLSNEKQNNDKNLPKLRNIGYKRNYNALFAIVVRNVGNIVNKKEIATQFCQEIKNRMIACLNWVMKHELDLRLEYCSYTHDINNDLKKESFIDYMSLNIIMSTRNRFEEILDNIKIPIYSLEYERIIGNINYSEIKHWIHWLIETYVIESNQTNESRRKQIEQLVTEEKNNIT